MKTAIMQPCFIPYAGYFRLFCASDLFVMYDCVQFPRRGWVHRNQLKTQADELDWLSLPLQKQPMETVIKDLRFREDANNGWRDKLHRFQAFRAIEKSYPELFAILTDLSVQPSDYIVNCLREICRILAIPFNITYSASLNIPETVRGQDRILHIARHFETRDYVNASGGRELYSDDAFAQHGMKLHFLPDYQGKYQSIIQCLAELDPQQIRENLYAQL